MSDTTTIGTGSTLDRTLRLRDLAIQADAVPLPISLMPSAIPQPLPDDEPAVTDVRADPPPDQGTQTQADPQAAVTLAVASTAIVPDDAVLQSINAAIDAVRATLQPDTDGVQRIPFEPQADQVEDTEAAGIRAASPEGAVMADAAPTATAAPDTVTADSPPVGATPSGLPAVELAAPAAAEPVQDILQQDIVQGGLPVAPALDGVLHIGSAGSAALSIPSLGGLGLDALAGLLHVPSAAPSSSHDPDSALASLDDVASFVAIGVPDLLGADHLMGHETHSPLHLVGSGLI